MLLGWGALTKSRDSGEEESYRLDRKRTCRPIRVDRQILHSMTPTTPSTDEGHFWQRQQVDLSAKRTFLHASIWMAAGLVGLAAVLYAQLEARATIQPTRQRIWEYYDAHLQAWAQQQGVRLPIVPPHCEQAYHMFYLVCPSLQRRQALIAHLRERGILSVFHYQPLHLSEMGRRFGGREGACPITEEISDRLVRLPFYNDLSTADLERVVAAVTE